MVKTLKITSIVAAVICVVLVVLIVGFGLKGDPKIEKILGSPSIIQEIKKLLGKTPATSDLVSPLVKEAKEFANRIDPPPPPVNKQMATTKKTGSQTATKRNPAIPTPKGTTTPKGKFELIATCRYEDDPRKSLALINLPAKGNQWFRVGENVEHLVIKDILDGSIVFIQNGKESSVLMKQVPTTIRSLLAGDGGIETTQTGSFGPARGPERDLGVGNAYRVPQGGTRKARTYIPPGSKRNTGSAVFKPSGSTATRKPRSYVPPSASRSRKAPPKPTVQQRKEVLDDNITDIRLIMKNPNPSASEKELKEEQEALSRLLKLLENERQEAENPPKKDVEESDKNKVTE